LLKLPQGYSFLDIGAHFGDTIITMALNAKNNNRGDIRFFAFEPNKEKCKYIQKMNELNNLNIIVINAGVGNENCKIIPHHYKTTMKGTITYNKINQSLSDNTEIIDILDMITLNSIKDKIEPVGFMHIDVEGWESKVLEGSSNILNNINNKIFIIAECWDCSVSKHLGFSENPEQDILNIMSNYKYTRYEDLIDQEKNLVFFPNN
jgi:FkbM family methyltransferase